MCCGGDLPAKFVFGKGGLLARTLAKLLKKSLIKNRKSSIKNRKS